MKPIGRNLILGPSRAGLALALLVIPACMSSGQRARLIQDNEALRRDNLKFKRAVAHRDTTISILQTRVTNLEGLGPERRAALFSPVKLEFASLTGGADYDGNPGDDGVTVYLRLRDADGDVTKTPGRITVQLLDNSVLGQPRVIGVHRFSDPQSLRKAWHGKFGTQHYTLQCPFQDGARPSGITKIDVKAEFVDYLTGTTLTAITEVSISPSGANVP